MVCFFETVIKNITRGAQIKASVLDEIVSDEPTNMQYLMLANLQDGIISDELPYLKGIDSKYEKYCNKKWKSGNFQKCIAGENGDCVCTRRQ